MRPAQPPACSKHRPLVEAALGPDPDDDVLDAYAAEVPTCPACQRALNARLAVEDDSGGVLRLRPLDGAPDPLRGMPALWAAIREPQPRRRSMRGWALAALVLASIGAGLGAGLLAGRDAPPAESASSTPAHVAPAPPEPISPPSAGRRAPPLVPVEPTPLAIPAPAPAPLAPLPPLDAGDAVADAEDWPPPPFVDLRSGAPKGVATGPDVVQLVLSSEGPSAVGDRISLEVIASRATELSVCVDGPERGVVWRGAVPAGRTPLARDGRLQSFALTEAGTYRFAVGPDGTGRCEAPLHRVEIEVH